MYSTQVDGTRLIIKREVKINLDWSPIVPKILGRGGLFSPEGHSALICPGAPHTKHGPEDGFIPNNLFIVSVQQWDFTIILEVKGNIPNLTFLFPNIRKCFHE